MEAVPLTICNNCETIYIDTNADTNQDKFEIDSGRFEELPTLKDEDGSFFRGCPKCNTDGYLMDVTKDHVNGYCSNGVQCGCSMDSHKMCYVPPKLILIK